jgi:SAM-dependent methyltransferase
MKKLTLLVLLSALTALVPAGVGLGVETGTVYAQDRAPSLAPYVPTPQDIVDAMLGLAQVKKDDVVYDLGSGDGRIVITAAKKYGVRAVGFDIDTDLIRQARENAAKAGVSHLVEFREQDVMIVDLSGATVVTLYLLPDSNLRLRPRIQAQMRPGSRIVSHDFDMGDWPPAKVDKVKGENTFHEVHTLYLWRIPPR